MDNLQLIILLFFAILFICLKIIDWKWIFIKRKILKNNTILLVKNNAKNRKLAKVEQFAKENNLVMETFDKDNVVVDYHNSKIIIVDNFPNKKVLNTEIKDHYFLTYDAFDNTFFHKTINFCLLAIIVFSLSLFTMTLINLVKPYEVPVAQNGAIPFDEQYMCDSYQEQQSTKEEEYRQEVINLINEARVANGLEPLIEVEFMDDIAQARAEAHRDERTFWAHYTVKYGFPNEQLNEYGLLPAWLNPQGNSFEISAMGEKTPEEVVNDWLNSEVHYNFIMNPNWKYIGVGFADEDWPYYYYEDENGNQQCLPFYYIEQRQGTSHTGTYVWTDEPSKGNYLSTYWIVWMGGYELSPLLDENYDDYDNNQ